MISCFIPSLKLTNRHAKFTILMVFTRKDGDFHGRTVSFREGKCLGWGWLMLGWGWWGLVDVG